MKLYVDYKNTGAADGTAIKPFPTVGQALAVMTGVMGGYVLDIAPGVYIDAAALATPAEALTVYGNGATLVAAGGLTIRGKFINYELTITGTITVGAGGSIDTTIETTQALLAATIAEIQARFVEGIGTGVYTGLVVAQQTVANMTVKISAGTVYMADGRRYAIAAKASQAVTAAHATLARIDIIYVSTAGVITYLAGTAAASPSAPATPTGGALLAEIAVAGAATTVATANITDKRTLLHPEE